MLFHFYYWTLVCCSWVRVYRYSSLSLLSTIFIYNSYKKLFFLYISCFRSVCGHEFNTHLYTDPKCYSTHAIYSFANTQYITVFILKIRFLISASGNFFLKKMRIICVSGLFCLVRTSLVCSYTHLHIRFFCSRRCRERIYTSLHTRHKTETLF